MKQAILAFLKTKMPGVQAAYLDGVADRYSKIITEEGQIETVLNDGVIDVLTFSAKHAQAEGDRRAQDAIRGYENKYNLKDGEKINTEPKKSEQPKQDEDVPEWAKTLIDTNKELAARIEAFEKEKETKTKEQAAAKAFNSSEKLAGLHEDLKKSWLSRIDPEKDLTEQIQSLEKEAEIISQLSTAKQAGKGLEVGGRVDGTVSEDEAKSLIEKM